MRSLLLMLCVLFLGCTHAPQGVTPVQNFELSRYLGTWYEIARLDHDFEQGLSQVTADYALSDDGDLQVINRGINAEGKWQRAQGTAKLISTENIGHLKVSFFGPFYGAYVIFHLDSNYQYAYVTSYNRDYLWLLSRTPKVSDAVKKDFIEQASILGYAVDELIWVAQ
ncbi:Outer membrane lipoprotein Blc [Vibrio stylophorae]|uniref:Outer membrane lipoprotein Blc n=1 Tax=Vibrio stylophorae TaxID=659351 RepID=A0ABN8DV42_9VIBR|nr:lipocalin family protein [Vibrio stylophorae]CAH0535187.1 Outer membrane lipoprotein Blc [Vibrio stylophorae]